MQYVASLPFNGNTDKAFRLAETTLTAIGFRLTERTTDGVEMVGPGMHSTRQSVLAGASRIHFAGGHDALTIEADLGGVEWMSRFVRLFPLGLCLVLSIVFIVVFSLIFGPGIWIIILAVVMGANILLWLLIGPRMARGIQVRTCRGLDTLLANMVTAGEST